VFKAAQRSLWKLFLIQTKLREIFIFIQPGSFVKVKKLGKIYFKIIFSYQTILAARDG